MAIGSHDLLAQDTEQGLCILGFDDLIRL